VSDESERARQHTRKEKARFDAAHRKGMDALRRRDLDALDEAITEEAAAIASMASGTPAPSGTPPRKHAAKKR
jgi:hypothetical protein